MEENKSLVGDRSVLSYGLSAVRSFMASEEPVLSLAGLTNRTSYSTGPRKIQLVDEYRVVNYTIESERACCLVVSRASMAPQFLGSTSRESEFSRI